MSAGEPFAFAGESNTILAEKPTREYSVDELIKILNRKGLPESKELDAIIHHANELLDKLAKAGRGFYIDLNSKKPKTSFEKNDCLGDAREGMVIVKQTYETGRQELGFMFLKRFTFPLFVLEKNNQLF